MLHHCLSPRLICPFLRLQSNLKFIPTFLLQESATLGPLWSNLVDCDKVYDRFDVETAQLGSARETLRGMRQERKARDSRAMAAATQAAYQTLSSQYISSSQSGGVISSFLGRRTTEGGPNVAESQGGSLPLGNTQSDLSASLLLDGRGGPAPLGFQSAPPPAAEEESIVETAALDEDDFDQNPVMSALLRVLEHLYHKQGAETPQEMPPWMQALHHSFTSAATPINVKLFLAKVIVRARKLFVKYKDKWFAPLIEVGLQTIRMKWLK